ncbi:MAG: hypothetical protein NC254_09150 [bacterium]|nr:hypothetical protein [bacterium]
MSTVQSQVIQSLDGLSDENLRFILEIIQRFMKPVEVNEKAVADGRKKRRIGSLEGQDLVDADYDIDECNDEIAEMFGV